MPLPNDLQEAIDVFLKNTDIQTLEKASLQLSENYRAFKGLSSYEEHLAYLAARLPATYEVILKVLQEIAPLSISSILDMGAGPGTVEWAANEVWKNPSLTAIEYDPVFIELGKKLGSKAEWVEKNLQASSSFTPHDLIIFNYSLGELSDLSLLKKIWPLAGHAVVIVEPGTPKGYDKMLEARQILIDLGGHVWAPCPHSLACPLPEGDWCHFSVRVERRFLHRKAKKAILPYEDEKYSYVIVGKEPSKSAACRLIREPKRRPGHVRLFLCCPDGLEETIVSKKEGAIYKEARKLSWGDTFKP